MNKVGLDRGKAALNNNNNMIIKCSHTVFYDYFYGYIGFNCRYDLLFYRH